MIATQTPTQTPTRLSIRMLDRKKWRHCFWTEAGGGKKQLYIGKLTKSWCDNLVLQSIDISQHDTGCGKKKKRLGFKWPLCLILLTCCHNKGLNFSQTSRIAHYQDFDSNPAENEWLSSVMWHQIHQQQLNSWTQICSTREGK